MKPRFLLLSLSVALGVSSSSRAQSPPVPPTILQLTPANVGSFPGLSSDDLPRYGLGDATVPRPAGAPGIPGSVMPGNPAGTNAGPDPAEIRLQQLLQLRLDRRPEALLQASAKQLARTTPEAVGVTNEVERLQFDLVTGNWRAVSALLNGLSTNHGPRLYDHLLQQFLAQPSSGGMPGRMGAGGSPMPSPPMLPGLPPPMHFLVPDDVLALANVCPGPLTDERLLSLGQLFGRSIQTAPTIGPVLARLESGAGRIGGADPEARQRAAQLLIAAGRLAEAGPFLRPLDPAAMPRDFPLIDVHATLLAAAGREVGGAGGDASGRRRESLRKAWDLNQILLTDTNCPAKERGSGLNRALDLLPALGRVFGSNWLRQNFTDRPELGAAVLGQIGGNVARAVTERQAANRLRFLRQQKQAADVLLESGADLQPWKPLLLVMAAGWAREAEFTRSRPVVNASNFGPQFDAFGNQMFVSPPQRFQDPNQPEPIAAAELLESAPGEIWLAQIDAVTVARVRHGVLQMQFRAGKYDESLPGLERLARQDARLGRTLALDLLNGWADARQPNRPGGYGPRYFNPYMNQGGEGIPLTRARQERNLEELGRLLARLRGLPVGPLDDAVVVSAFTRAHSPAEVFRVEDIERVFGRIEALGSATLAELVQSMRSRLAGQWRQPRVQQDAKTRRNDKEIATEVRRGYETLARLLEPSPARPADDWRVATARAATLYDWAEFEYGQKVDLAVYTGKRDEAFRTFEKAAALYAADLSKLEEEEQSPRVFQQWFNATLGASDLSYLTRQTEPSTNQLGRIRTALLALPAEAAERHLGAFARDLSESAGGLRPELKPRYARAGLEIVGNHPAAAEARDLVRHYDELLREVTLDVRVDGEAAVGHGQPFGVFVSIRHTEAVGRESGGFGRYLQNQGNLGYYYNPNGGGPVNYRDEFEKQVREKYADGFEVKLVTFHDDKGDSRGTDRPGWRDFPYAYLLLVAKDASVDKLPPLQLSMDFTDARGQVSLPIVSAPVLIDARAEHPAARPVRDLEVTSILDDRELAQGTATLEIKATARGLVPDLDRLVDPAIPGFRSAKIDDRGLSLTQMDATNDVVAPVSERAWILTLVPDRSGPAASEFVFPKPLRADVKVTCKRYADADLVEAPPRVALAGVPMRGDRAGWWVAGGVGLGILVWLGWLRRRPADLAAAVAPRYVVPAEVTPFSVIHLLQRVAGDAAVGLNDEQRRELAETVARLQRRFFDRAGDGAAGETGLPAVAERWVRLAEGAVQDQPCSARTLAVKTSHQA